MLNVNSPIVQHMLANTPPAQGNFPLEFYNGNTPTITRETAPVMQSPYPSPMEMSMSIPQPQSMMYQQPMMVQQPMMTTQQPMGYYGYQYMVPQQPVPQPAFMQGYSNPYFNPAMSQPNYTFNNRFDPNVYGQMVGQRFSPDQMVGYNPGVEDCRIIMNSAMENGISYQDQLKNESKVLKMASRAVAKARGLSEEDIEKAQRVYDIKKIEPRTNSNYDPFNGSYQREVEERSFTVMLVRGDKVIADSSKQNHYAMSRRIAMCDQDAKRTLQSEHLAFIQRINWINNANYLYDHSIDRQADHMDFFDILNNFCGKWIAQAGEDRIREERRKNTGFLYNREEFRKLQRDLALKNNYGGYFGVFSSQIDTAMNNDRLYGGYGYLPGGIPTTPGREMTGYGISVDSQGKVHMECPQFMRDYFAREHEAENRLKNRTQARVDYLRDRFKETCKQVEARERMAGNGC